VTATRRGRRKGDGGLWALAQLVVAAVILALYLLVLTRGWIVTR
jgi:hypothetical protein